MLKPNGEEYAQWVEACFQRAGFIPKIFSVDYKKSRGLTHENIARMSDYAAVVKVQLD